MGGVKLFFNIIFRIILPTIIFAAIEYVPNCLIRGRTIDFQNAVYKSVGGGTYWFTSALAISELIILVLLITRKQSMWLYFILCVLIGGTGIYYQNGLYQVEIWAWHRGVIAVMILACGGLYWRYEDFIIRWMKGIYIALMIVIYFLLLLYINSKNPNISILSLQPFGIVTTLLSCVLLIEMCKHLPENKILNYIGQNTLGFYFACGAVPAVVTPLFHRLTTEKYLLMMLAELFFCLAIAYTIVLIINRWLPWMFDLRLLKKK